MNDNHYPDVNTDDTKSQQASDATKQAFGTLRGRIAVVLAHALLVVSPFLLYEELTTPTPECTASEAICAFSPGSLGLPLIAIAAATSAFVVVVYWAVIRRD